jgi:hypothetical protein
MLLLLNDTQSLYLLGLAAAGAGGVAARAVQAIMHVAVRGLVVHMELAVGNEGYPAGWFAWVHMHCVDCGRRGLAAWGQFWCFAC